MTFLQQYWYVGALFSALYTIGSIWWSVRIERRIRAIYLEQRVADIAYGQLRNDVDDVQAFLENGNTLREIKIIPLRPRRREDA